MGTWNNAARPRAYLIRESGQLPPNCRLAAITVRCGDLKMASWISQATAFGVRLSRVGRQFVDERTLAEHLRRARVGPVRPPAWMRRRFEISSTMRNGYEVFTVAPRTRRQGSDRAAGNVMYIHGGAFVEGIFRWHWYFIGWMAERLGMTFTVPLYPLAPEHDCAAVSTVVLGVYRELLAQYDPSRLVVMGDSAGGGIAMSLAMQAIAAGLAAPAALVLVSPWLDVTMTDPAQIDIEKVDPLLLRAGPKAAGRWYAGAMSTTDPRVSPIYGDIAGLPPILMFCGTHDILLTDARRLAKRAAAEGIDVGYHEEPGLMHVYPLLFFPESRKARDRIVEFVHGAVGKPRPASAASASPSRHDSLAVN
jgi:acetyl esterase/lipase